MDYNKYMVDTTKMDDRVLALYSKTAKLLKDNEKMNEIAMAVLQSLGYNGFKRWHRCRSREFHEYSMRLSNELFDKFHMTMKPDETTLAYAPANMNAHLMSWKEMLLDSIEKLGTYSQEYFSLTGMQNDIMECAMHKLTRDYEKVCRYYDRFMEGDWLVHDMHIVDDCIHHRYKKKEDKHGYKY